MDVTKEDGCGKFGCLLQRWMVVAKVEDCSKGDQLWQKR
jgi:hypothetical protein